MASNLLKLHHLQTTTLKPSPPSLSIPKTLTLCCTLPPTTRDDAISQAKLSLSSTLKKPLNNPAPIPISKLKKLTQPRYRVEIPVVDDSRDSLAQLAAEVFASLPVTRKGSKPRTLILWPTPAMAESAYKAFTSASSSVTNSVLGSVSSEVIKSADLAVFLAPEASQIQYMKAAADSLYPKPVVLFNPRWGFEDEEKLELGGFVGSFDVVYSFMGLEVRGVIRRRKGVVFRCVQDGVVSGRGWEVLVEDDEETGKLRVVSSFKKRPTIGEVENVLYNLMAASSPVTKSIKFMKDLASQVTRKEKL